MLKRISWLGKRIVKERRNNGIKDLKIDESIDLIQDRLKRMPQGRIQPALINSPALDIIINSRTKGLNASPEQVALGFIAEPVYTGAFTSGNKEQAIQIQEFLQRQTQQSSAAILKQLEGLVEKPRVIRMMEIMTGRKITIN